MVTARDGAVTKINYDEMDNVLQEVTFGDINVVQGPGGNVVTSTPAEALSRVQYEYDARNRVFLTKEQLLHYPNLGYTNVSTSTLNPGQLSTALGLGNYVAHALVYDRLGRPIFSVDAENDVTSLDYDGLGRAVRIEDALGNVTENDHDPIGNLTVRTEMERPSSGGSLVETFVYRTDYDAVNRPWRVTEPNGRVTALQYDSRDNLVLRVDPLRNIVQFAYDRAQRPTETTQWLSKTGTDASPFNFDGNQGGDPNLAGAGGAPDGKILIKQEWDKIGRLKKRIDDRTNETHYTYDALHRMTGTVYGDNTSERFFYNDDSEMWARIDQAGVIVRSEFDAEGRRTLADYSLGTTGVVGTTRQRWSYDGLGRTWATFDDNGNVGGVGAGNDVLVRFRYDSLGRVISEQQKLGANTASPTEIVYEGAARVLEDWYPSGRVVGRGYDALDRLQSVDDLGGQRQHRGYDRRLRVHRPRSPLNEELREWRLAIEVEHRHDGHHARERGSV